MTEKIVSELTLPRRHLLAGLAAAGAAAGIGLAARPAAAQAPGPLAGKVALITGGHVGYGAVTVAALAQARAKVAFNGRREALGREVEAQVREAGGDVAYLKSDVRDASQVERFVADTVERFGGLDVAFNNAGVDLPPLRSLTQT